LNREFETALLPDKGANIHLFRPHVPRKAIEFIREVLESRWIGQGPKVSEFENEISKRFCNGLPGIAVGSGTDALHLAYLLCDIKANDEVLVPVFTCTATSIPLLYMGAKPVFVDVNKNNMNIDVSDLERKITKRTKAITVVHYSGLPCDMELITEIGKEYGLPIIEDAAHALGGSFNNKPIGSISDFTVFSFQAIKHLTTGDGGYLSIRNQDLLEKAKRLRWFGIDRKAKQDGIWDNDILEIGYKYQMTDLSAALGLAGLAEFTEVQDLRKLLFERYVSNLSASQNIVLLDTVDSAQKIHAHWMFTIATKNRRKIQAKLYENGIESSQVHFRNDRYKIFRDNREILPNMDAVEDYYLVLPLHTQMKISDIDKVCEIVADNS